MPISEDERAVVNRLKEHLRGPMPNDLVVEVQAALREYEERKAESEKSEVRKWAESQLGRMSARTGPEEK